MESLDQRITVVAGDITRLAVDAIVNAANTTLLGGAGVDGAIHRAAGRQLLAACRSIGGCPVGQARITNAYRLPARYVIHTVGPVWRGGDRNEDALLASCYRESLHLAKRNAIEAIAFPAISTGAYRFPLERATKIAVNQTVTWLSQNPLPRQVAFCCFNPDIEAIYRQVIADSQSGDRSTSDVFLKHPTRHTEPSEQG